MACGAFRLFYGPKQTLIYGQFSRYAQLAVIIWPYFQLKKAIYQPQNWVNGHKKPELMDLEYSSTVVSWSQAGFRPYLEKHLVSILDRMYIVVRIRVARKERFFKLNRLQMKSVFEGWAWCQVSEGCQTTIEGRQDFQLVRNSGVGCGDRAPAFLSDRINHPPTIQYTNQPTKESTNHNRADQPTKESTTHISTYQQRY